MRNRNIQNLNIRSSRFLLVILAQAGIALSLPETGWKWVIRRL
jgi:hypothetical protein